MIGQGCGLLYNVRWYVKLKYEKRLQQVDDPKRLVYHSIRNLKCSILSNFHPMCYNVQSSVQADSLISS